MSTICNEEWGELRSGEKIVESAHFLSRLTVLLEYFDFNDKIREAVEEVIFTTSDYSQFAEYLKDAYKLEERSLSQIIQEVVEENDYEYIE